MTISTTVHSYPTTNEQGFNKTELNELITNHYPHINTELFWCAIMDAKDPIPPTDVIHAVKCGLYKARKYHETHPNQQNRP